MKICTLILLCLTLMNCAHGGHRWKGKKQARKSVVNLFTYSDNKQWDQIRPLLAPKVDMEKAGKTQTLSAEDFITAWDKKSRTVEKSHTQLGNMQIQKTDTGFQISCYATKHKINTNKRKKVTTAIGTYTIDLVSESGAPLIEKISYKEKFTF